MNVMIICFSQTGNTRRAADAMAAEFGSAGYAAQVIPLSSPIPQDAVSGDLLGIGTPCFSSQAPTPVKDFLAALPPLYNRRGFVFATCSGAPGRVLYDLTRPLQSKGMEVVGGCLVRGAVHHPAPCLVDRFPNRPDEADMAGVRRFAAAVARHVSAGDPGPVAETHPDTFRPGGRFYGLVARLSSDAFLRRTLPEPRLQPALCDQCGWCMHECPIHNIILQPFPCLGSKCIRCYRCLTGCPLQAFEADWRWSNLAIQAFYNPVFERWFGDLQPGEQVYGVSSRRGRAW